MVLKNLNVTVFVQVRLQGLLQGLAGGICGMYHTAFAVAALAGQVITAFTDFLAIFGKWHTKVRQPLNTLAAPGGGKSHDFRIAKPGAGSQRILYVLIDTVVRLEYC